MIKKINLFYFIIINVFLIRIIIKTYVVNRFNIFFIIIVINLIIITFLLKSENLLINADLIIE